MNLANLWKKTTNENLCPLASAHNKLLHLSFQINSPLRQLANAELLHFVSVLVLRVVRKKFCLQRHSIQKVLFLTFLSYKNMYMTNINLFIYPDICGYKLVVQLNQNILHTFFNSTHNDFNYSKTSGISCRITAEINQSRQWGCAC